MLQCMFENKSPVGIYFSQEFPIPNMFCLIFKASCYTLHAMSSSYTSRKYTITTMNIHCKYICQQHVLLIIIMFCKLFLIPNFSNLSIG